MHAAAEEPALQRQARMQAMALGADLCVPVRRAIPNLGMYWNVGCCIKRLIDTARTGGSITCMPALQYVSLDASWRGNGLQRFTSHFYTAQLAHTLE